MDVVADGAPGMTRGPVCFRSLRLVPPGRQSGPATAGTAAGAEDPGGRVGEGVPAPITAPPASAGPVAGRSRDRGEAAGAVNAR